MAKKLDEKLNNTDVVESNPSTLSSSIEADLSNKKKYEYIYKKKLE